MMQVQREAISWTTWTFGNNSSVCGRNQQLSCPEWLKLPLLATITSLKVIVSANTLEKGWKTASSQDLQWFFSPKRMEIHYRKLQDQFSRSNFFPPTPESHGHSRCLVIMAMSFCALPQELGHRVWRQAGEVASFRWRLLGWFLYDGKLNGKVSGNFWRFPTPWLLDFFFSWFWIIPPKTNIYT